MSTAEETISAFQKSLGPFIKPREQVNYIRRVLALELGSHIGDGPIQQPLSLVEGPLEVQSDQELKGIYNEYITALRDNVAVKTEFEAVRQNIKLQATDSASSWHNNSSRHGLLDEHLSILKLRKKHDSLDSVQSCLDELSQKPAANRDTLGLEKFVKGCKPMPNVPAEVINSFVAEHTDAQPDLQSRVNLLEKVVLRAKLALKQEERLLSEARARSTKMKPELLSNGGKLQALNTTRNELINWIETELGKASTMEDEEAKNDKNAEQQGESLSHDELADIPGQLNEIQAKYAQYTAARKELIGLVSESHQPSIPPPTQENSYPTAKGAETGKPPPLDYLLTPYVEALASVSRSQKNQIVQKAHIAATLGRQTKDTNQVLSRLAEESQLLPAHPMKDSARRRSGVPDVISGKSADRPDAAKRIRPWVFASDAAKIATLETVAETVEGGQLALEKSMTTLHHLHVLLGLEDDQNAEENADCSEGDLWLDNNSPRKATITNKTPKKKPQAMSHGKADPWAKVHGNLGLIGHDNAP